jgi:3-methyladenine DNA glycosylase/8-oxoguanine DNA glycosylase
VPLDPATLRKATARLRRSDPVLAAIMRDVGPCRLRTDEGGGAFASLVESIVYQQITGKAAASIYRRVRTLVGRRHPRPQDILAATVDALRQAGLSRQKALYLRDLSERVRDGLKLRALGRLENEAVIEALTEVKGIGRWTVEMFLIFRLGRLDVLPVHDYGIRKAMQRAYRFRKLPDPDRMRRLAEPWRPYRTVACWYLWRSLEARGARPER